MFGLRVFTETYLVELDLCQNWIQAHQSGPSPLMRPSYVLLLHQAMTSIGSPAITTELSMVADWICKLKREMSSSLLFNKCFSFSYRCTHRCHCIVNLHLQCRIRQKQFSSKCGDIFYFLFKYLVHIPHCIHQSVKAGVAPATVRGFDHHTCVLGCWTGTFHFCHGRDLTHSTTSDSSLFALITNVLFESSLQNKSSLDLRSQLLLCPVTSITATPIISIGIIQLKWIISLWV